VFISASVTRLPSGEAVVLLHVLDDPIFCLESSLFLNVQALDCWPMLRPYILINLVSLDNASHIVSAACIDSSQ
jgi:hypothetical protein